MGLNEYLDNQLVKVDEGSLIIAQQIQEQLISFQIEKKKIDKQEKELKNKLEDIMRENNITKYESNDKKLMITLGEDSITETIDKNELWLQYPDVFRKVVKETPRKGSLRITIREDKNEISDK